MRNTCIIVIFILIICVSCRRSKVCALKLHDLKAEYSHLLIGTFEQGDYISEFRDKSVFQATPSGYYVFNSNGILKSYRFFVSESEFVYGEFYDLNGRLDRIVGSPLVYNKVYFLPNDSVRVSGYFYLFNKKYKSIDVDVNGKNRRLELKRDSTFSNMGRSTLTFKHPYDDTTTVYYKYEYVDVCTGQSRIERDSVHISIDSSRQTI